MKQELAMCVIGDVCLACRVLLRIMLRIGSRMCERQRRYQEGERAFSSVRTFIQYLQSPVVWRADTYLRLG